MFRRLVHRPLQPTRVVGPVFGVAIAVAGVAVAVALLGGSLRLGAMLHAIEHGDLAALRTQLRASGTVAALAVLILALAHTVLPFPAEILSAAAGFALGVPLAVAILLVGLLISAVITYLLGLHLGRPAAMAMVGARRLEGAECFVQRGGVRALLVLRLFPLIPFSPVCLACGLVRVPLRRYLWTTALGLLPELTLVTFIGSHLNDFSLARPVIWGPLAGLLALVVLGPVMMRHADRGERSAV